MTDTALTALVQSNIDRMGLPFPIHASAAGGVVSVEVRGRVANPTVYSTTFVPTDVVLMREMNPAMDRCITRANMIQHMGGEVF